MSIEAAIRVAVGGLREELIAIKKQLADIQAKLDALRQPRP